jgi:flagellar biosynthesis protein FlhG
LAAHQQIIAVTPEPTSIENAYRFLKSSFYRKLRVAETELGIKHLIETAMDSRNELGIRSPADLIQRIRQSDTQAGERLDAMISEFRPQIVVNQTRTRVDVELGYSIKSVCTKYFGVDATYLGHIDHDNAVWQSLRKRRPMIIEHPYSSIVGQFMAVSKNLMNPQSLRAVV